MPPRRVSSFTRCRDIDMPISTRYRDNVICEQRIGGSPCDVTRQTAQRPRASPAYRRSISTIVQHVSRYGRSKTRELTTLAPTSSSSRSMSDSLDRPARYTKRPT